jgi:cytochrome b6-f complex iron-sulfur subunit
MTALIVIVVTVLVVAGLAASFFAAGRRDTTKAVGKLSAETKSRDRTARKAASQELATTGGAEVEPWTPPTAMETGMARRQFLNRGIVGLLLIGPLSGLATGLIAFLWPSLSGGFGSKVTLGKLADIDANITKGNGFYYVPEGKLYVTRYPSSALPKAKTVYAPSELTAMEAGFTVLYQKCVHLGCRVPPCLTSQWFECPCHGSQYNQVGEKKGGPAPRGLDHFATSVANNVLTADTGTIILGPPIGTDTTGQEAEGPHCISGGE